MKRIAIALALISSLLLPTSANAANPKVGSACSKHNQVVIYKSAKYQCVKSGKKMIWSKPMPAATAAIPAKPAFVAPEAPTSFNDLIANYEGIAYAAWAKSKAKIEASSPTLIPVSYMTGPNTKISYKTPQVAFDLASRLYAGSMYAKKLTVISFSFADRDWAQTEADKFGTNIGKNFIAGEACASEDDCAGAAVFHDNQANYIMIISTGTIDANHTSGTLEAHEYTHTIQLANLFGSQVDNLPVIWPPQWITEGQATFSQHVSIYWDNFDGYMKYRKESSSDLFRYPQYNSEYFSDYLVVNPPDSWNEKYPSWRRYDVGAMFVEILVALQGPDSVMQLWKLGGTGVQFKDAFAQVYGTSFDDALPIMSKAMALELGRK